jgi:hypothetical protein
MGGLGMAIMLGSSFWFLVGARSAEMGRRPAGDDP